MKVLRVMNNNNLLTMYESRSYAHEKAKQDYLEISRQDYDLSEDEAIKEINHFGACHSRDKKGNDYYAFCFNSENTLSNYCIDDDAKKIWNDIDEIEYAVLEEHCSRVKYK